VSKLTEQVETIKNGAKYQAIKNHFETNKKIYAGFGVGVLVTLAIRRPQVHIINTVSPIFNNNNSSNVIMGGYLHKIVQCVETGEIFWKGVGEAAEKAGATLHAMSRHLNGHDGYETVKGLTYKIIGVGN